MLERPRMLEASSETQVLSRALLGEPAYIRALLRHITPAVHASVARAMVAWTDTTPRNLAEEVRDQTQEVLGALFAERGRILRTWRPGRGCTLRSFVAIVARRRTISMLRTQCRNPWSQALIEPTQLAGMADVGPSVEDELLAWDLRTKALALACDSLTHQGRRMLRWLVVDQLSVAEVMRQGRMSRDAVYQWRSRVLRALRLAYAELDPN